MCLKCLGKSAILVVYQGKIQPNFALVILSSFRVVVGVLRGAFPERKKEGGTHHIILNGCSSNSIYHCCFGSSKYYGGAFFNYILRI